jgi:hypothetical protein
MCHIWENWLSYVGTSCAVYIGRIKALGLQFHLYSPLIWKASRLTAITYRKDHQALVTGVCASVRTAVCLYRKQTSDDGSVRNE